MQFSLKDVGRNKLIITFAGKIIKTMYSTIFNGIGAAFQWFFQFLPAIGMLVAIFFWILIAIGCTYWLIYGMKLEDGADNYLAVRGSEDEEDTK